MNESQWIDVNERLPEVSGYVFCLYKEKLPFTAMFHKAGGYFTHRLNDVAHPAYWMPLPQPPEQKDVKED